MPPPGENAGSGPVSGASPGVRHATHARTFFLFGSRELFAETATYFFYAAGWGPRQKGVAQGHSALMASLPALVQQPGGGHPSRF